MGVEQLEGNIVYYAVKLFNSVPTIALFHNIMLSREIVFNSCLRKNRADRQERKTTNAIWPSELRALRFQYNI